MATAETLHESLPPLPPAARDVAAFVDRWIYVGMASLIMAVVLIGFIPDSIFMLRAMEVGQAPPIPPILHVHAVLMGSWITLLLAQTVLMATGRDGWHMQLGMAGFVLMPAIVVAGFLLVPTRFGQLMEMIAIAPPAVAEQLRTETVPFVTNILAAQIRIGIVFPLIVGTALYFRRRDSEVHKRLMILATLGPLPAALDRMWYLPTSMPESNLTVELYPLLLALPMLAWDIYRKKTIPKAYWIWLAIVVPGMIFVSVLWNEPWWLEAGPRLLGY